MDIAKRLEEICDKYGLSKTSGEFQEEINKIVSKTLQELVAGRRVGIRGGGEHTGRLLDLLPDKSPIIGIYDDFARYEKLREIKIYPVRDLSRHHIDTVLISSFAFRKEIAAELAGQENQFAVIDLYEELAKRGFWFDEAFYLRSGYAYSYVISLQNRYRAEKTAADRGELLKDIHDALRRRSRHEKKDIVIHLCDSVKYESVGDMPYLSESFRKGTFFENAYAVTPYTRPAIAAMFYKLHVIEDYNIQKSTKENLIVSLAKEKVGGWGGAYGTGGQRQGYTGRQGKENV